MCQAQQINQEIYFIADLMDVIRISFFFPYFQTHRIECLESLFKSYTKEKRVVMSETIRQFESVVIRSLQLYTCTVECGTQVQVLDLLVLLLQLHVNYNVLDGEHVFLKYILKQLELLEMGQLVTSQKLLLYLFRFLIHLSHDKVIFQHNILTYGHIMQYCDSLMAVNDFDAGIVQFRMFNSVVRSTYRSIAWLIDWLTLQYSLIFTDYFRWVCLIFSAAPSQKVILPVLRLLFEDAIHRRALTSVTGSDERDAQIEVVLATALRCLPDPNAIEIIQKFLMHQLAKSAGLYEMHVKELVEATFSRIVPAGMANSTCWHSFGKVSFFIFFIFNFQVLFDWEITKNSYSPWTLP